MFERDWFIAVAFGLVVIACAGVAGKYSWDVFSSYQQYHANERIAATEYQAATPQHSQRACGSIMLESGLLNGLACLADNISTDGSEKQAEYDLKAQQDMAAWSLGMLLVTLWLTVITFLGVFFVWRTLLATQKMATDTRKIGEAQARAYVHIQRSEIYWDATRQKNRVRIVFKNFGQTPARSVMLYGARKLGLPEPFSSDATLDNGSEFSDMGPQADFTWSFDLYDPVHDEILPGGAQRQLRILGRVEYVDAFGERRQTTFALKTNPTNDMPNAELHLAERANHGT